MTSNQLQFAYNNEINRHNTATEELSRREQDIQQEANAQLKRYQTAQVLLGVSNELNKAGGIANQSMSNMINQSRVYVEAQNNRANQQLAKRKLALETDVSTENIRHLREQDRLALRDIENKERLTTLQARMNEMTISNMLFEQNRALNEGYLKQAQLALQDRQTTAMEFKNDIEAFNAVTQGNRLLMDLRSQKYKIPIDIVNAQANIIKAISSKLY
jgi:hypothetical protein